MKRIEVLQYSHWGVTSWAATRDNSSGFSRLLVHNEPSSCSFSFPCSSVTYNHKPHYLCTFLATHHLDPSLSLSRSVAVSILWSSFPTLNGGVQRFAKFSGILLERARALQRMAGLTSESSGWQYGSVVEFLGSYQDHYYVAK